MTIESDATREELRALLDFPAIIVSDHCDDVAFKKRAGKIIAALPLGTPPKVWWV